MEWQGAISGAIAALGGKILFDWLRHPRVAANGHPEYKTLRKDMDEMQRLEVVRRIVREEIDNVIRNEFEYDPRRHRSSGGSSGG